MCVPGTVPITTRQKKKKKKPYMKCTEKISSWIFRYFGNKTKPDGTTTLGVLHSVHGEASSGRKRCQAGATKSSKTETSVTFRCTLARIIIISMQRLYINVRVRTYVRTYVRAYVCTYVCRYLMRIVCVCMCVCIYISWRRYTQILCQMLWRRGGRVRATWCI